MGRHTLEYRRGVYAENVFLEIAEREGYKVIKSDTKDDMFKHIDFYLTKDDDRIAVDVKSRKKAGRNSSTFDDIYTWVEFKNVRGDKGWLYGEADKIAFERKEDFVLINRECLLNYCLETVQPVSVDSPQEATYKHYTRRNRNDLLSRIKIRKLFNSRFVSEPLIIWKKDVDMSNQ